MFEPNVRQGQIHGGVLRTQKWIIPALTSQACLGYRFLACWKECLCFNLRPPAQAAETHRADCGQRSPNSSGRVRHSSSAQLKFAHRIFVGLMTTADNWLTVLQQRPRSMFLFSVGGGGLGVLVRVGGWGLGVGERRGGGGRWDTSKEKETWGERSLLQGCTGPLHVQIWFLGPQSPKKSWGVFRKSDLT